MERYVTTRDVVIPAGSEIIPAPHQVRRFVPFGEIAVAINKDSTASLSMPLDEAVSAGLARKIGTPIMDGAA